MSERTSLWTSVAFGGYRRRSADFLFDRSTEGRSIKYLMIVDDTTHDSVVIVAERTIGGQLLTRILDRLAATRGLSQALCTGNGKNFAVEPC